MLSRIRLMIQVAFTIATNGYLYGFISGKIYKGKSKYSCVPGLNCYSCPGAIASCPLGALQSALNQRQLEVPFAVLGFLFLFGSLLGRFTCGWLCPFGLLQDLLYKIPCKHKRKQMKGHHIWKYAKYVFLFVFVIFGSAVLLTGFAKVPAFCKYICPSGTLLGAIPLMSTNEALRAQAGGLFYWKILILLVILVASVKLYRPFCQYICPLGAIYGWFNRYCLVQITWEKESCNGCMACQRACPMQLTPAQISVSPECIKCGKCIQACNRQCLTVRPKRRDEVRGEGCGKEEKCESKCADI